MEQILRTLVEPHQKDWDLYLSQVEFAVNDSVHAVHGFTPFEMNYGEPMYSTLDWVLEAQRSTPVSSFNAQRLANDMRQMVSRARTLLEKANLKMAADRAHKVRDVKYQEGDRVVLSSKNIVTEATTRGVTSLKLKKPFCGPFRVTKVMYTTGGQPHAYKLDLPAHWRCHPVFKARYLEPYFDGARFFPSRKQKTLGLPAADPRPAGWDEPREVDRVLRDREIMVRRGRQTVKEHQWLVRYKGDPVGDEWLPIERLSDDLKGSPEWEQYERARTGLQAAMLRLAADPTEEQIRQVELQKQRVDKLMGRYTLRAEKARLACHWIQDYEEGSRQVQRVPYTADAGGETLRTVEPYRPSKLRVLVLFSGTGTVEQAVHRLFRNAEVITVDSEARWAPTHCVDIRDWASTTTVANFSQYPRHYFHMIWASPPCEEYSQAKTRGGRDLALADARVAAALKIMDELERMGVNLWHVRVFYGYSRVCRMKTLEM